MPYIPKRLRENYDQVFEATKLAKIEVPGELNYLITKLCHMYLESKSGCYGDYNEVIGVLECAKLEFYRRKVAAYEEVKIEENGDA